MYVNQSKHYGNIELGRPRDTLWSRLKRIMQSPPGALELGKLVQGISHLLRQRLLVLNDARLHLVLIVARLHLVLVDAHLQAALQEQLQRPNCYPRELYQLRGSGLQPLLPHQVLLHQLRMMCIYPEGQPVAVCKRVYGLPQCEV